MKEANRRFRSEQLHHFVLFAGNTGLRPDEAWRLEFRDVTAVDDEDLGKTIPEIEVRGKLHWGIWFFRHRRRPGLFCGES